MANDKLGLHLPLDEIRVSGETAVAPNVGAVGGDAVVHGNPKIIHDPTMGTCMQFDGQDDYLELTDPAAATFAQGMTVAAWVRFEDVPSYGRIFDLNVAQNDKTNIIWAGNEGRSQTLAYEIDGVRFTVDDGVALRAWRHYAFVYEPEGKVSVLIDGVAAFRKDVPFDIANTAWKTGYVGKSSYTVDKLFHGAIAHFRLYNHALTAAEINDLMIKDRSAMAHYRETTLLKVDLYTIRDDDHKPILYVEAENKGEPLEVSLINPTDKAIAFKPFTAPTAVDFHVQLRFRRNIIAPNVLKNLQKDGGVTIDGWRHAAGTTADGREDYISFVKADENLALDKGASWRIRIPDFSAAAQGGARNTRIQVRYRTEPQDPGSVVRHMEVQSHLGLKTIPLIARFRDSNTILNNGQTANELTIEVVYIKDTGSVRLDNDSKFGLIVDTDLLASGNSLDAAPGVAWLEAQPAESGIGHETVPFHVKLSGGDEQPLPEVSRERPLTFALNNWITDKTSGTYNILLRYENIPGYWDGAWVLPVQFSPMLLRSNKIGIGTDEPEAALDVRGDVQIVGHAEIQGSAHINGDATIQGDAHVAGRIRDRTGFVMPVGAILAYGGSNAPEGWLLCDGGRFDSQQFPELYAALGYRDTVPDLRSRFVVGAGGGYRVNDQGGKNEVGLEVTHLPAHSHSAAVAETNIVNGGNSRETEYKVMHPDTYNRGNVGDMGADYSVYDRNGESAQPLSWCINFKHSHGITIDSTGSNTPHENRPPYYALTYIIKC